MPLSRRRFLHLSAALSLTACAALSLTACSGGSADSGSQTQDTGADLPALALSKAPWVQLLGPSTARLRFETREARALPVTIALPDGSSLTVTPGLREDELDYAWDFELEDVPPDEPGLHVLQEVLLEDLQPGAQYGWSVDLGGGEQVSGTFRAPPAAGEAFRFGWLADTMRPTVTETAAALRSAAPDLLLHGGDMVYQTSPADTWTGFWQAMATLFAGSALGVTLGNHDFEDMDEVHVMFERLFMPQGDSGANRYNAFSFGGVRFVQIDTESDRFGFPEEVEGMWDWVRAELQATADDPKLRFAIVLMHRPMFTLSKYWVSDATERDARHAMFVEFGVPLVFCGHVHAYEHWEVEGVHYIVDGGGGALSYDPVEEKAAVDEARPGESDQQIAHSRTYGVTVVDVAEDGRLSVQRLAAGTAAVEDAFTVG